MLRRFLMLAAAAAMAAGTGVAVTWTAQATTLTCTNISTAITAPYGCGGLQSGTGLDLAHVSNTWNGLVTAQADASTTTEDWTAFAVKPPTVVPPPPAHITGGDGYGVYVAMATPGGLIPGFTSVSGGACILNGSPVVPGPTDTLLSVDPNGRVAAVTP